MRAFNSFIALGALFLIPSCIRLNAPDEFVCYDATDCESGDICVREGSPNSAGICRPSGFCESDDACRLDEICSSERCVQVECNSRFDSHCEPYVCTDNECVTSCQDSTDCSDDYTCQDGECTTGECRSSELGSCGAYACIENACVSSCRSNDECGHNHGCDGSECQPVPQPLGVQCFESDECLSEACCPEGSDGLSYCGDC